MDWSHGVESWSGFLEPNFGEEQKTKLNAGKAS